MGQIKRLDKLPPKKEKIETVVILKQSAKSANALGELKGVAKNNT